MWDKKYGIMRNSCVSIYPDGSFDVDRLNEDGFLIEIACSENEELVPLQYTGLKDKNGKEIYEGDLVSLIATGSRVDVAEVKWSEAGWWAVYQNDATRRLYPANIQGEVIGNIHENPELLG